MRPLLGGNAEQEATLSASPGVFADFPADLNEKLVERLQELGIEKLYAHQAEAIESALAGHDTVTTVGTSSGKTLCYALPMLQKCLEEPSAKALLLFPTKALAHDQLDRLQELAEGSSLMSSCYDGDTPKSRRSMIRSSAHLILTNPDMLHMAILPQHEHWRKFFKSLRPPAAAVRVVRIEAAYSGEQCDSAERRGALRESHRSHPGGDQPGCSTVI